MANPGREMVSPTPRPRESIPTGGGGAGPADRLGGASPPKYRRFGPAKLSICFVILGGNTGLGKVRKGGKNHFSRAPRRGGSKGFSPRPWGERGEMSTFPRRRRSPRWRPCRPPA